MQRAVLQRLQPRLHRRTSSTRWCGAFQNGLRVEVSDIDALDGVRAPARRSAAARRPRSPSSGAAGPRPRVASAVEFILEGLHLSREAQQGRAGRAARATGCLRRDVAPELLLALGRQAAARRPRRRRAPGGDVRRPPGRRRPGARSGASSSAARSNPDGGQCPACRTCSSGCAGSASSSSTATTSPRSSTTSSRSSTTSSRPSARASSGGSPTPRAAQKGEAPSLARGDGAGRAEHRKTSTSCRSARRRAIKGLQDYEFMDPEAQRMFQELLKGLQQQMLQSFFQGMQQALGNMTPQDLERMREMLRDLNRCCRTARRAASRTSSVQAEVGRPLPGRREPRPADGADRASRAARCSRCSSSMSPEQRRQLQDMMQSLFMQDERLEAELRQLGMNLSQLMPPPDGRRYHFRGDDDALHEAGDGADGRAQAARRARAADPEASATPTTSRRSTPSRSSELLGEEAAQRLERLREMTKKLEEAGYLEQQGRPARADRAGHPQDRREGAARHLRAPQARPLRRPRASSAAARAATAPTRPSPTSSAIRSCSTCARR